MTRQTNTTISTSWAIAALLAISSAAAQDLTMPPTAMGGEPTLASPEAIPVGPAGDELSYVPGESMLAPAPQDFHDYDDQQMLSECNNDIWGGQPALTESTGSWLRRGFWYAELDAVVLNRMWNRDDKVLASDTTAVRRLHLMRTDPGAEGSVRLTLGRFLFRDVRNRDHTMEFVAFGGGEASQDDTLTSAVDGQTLEVPFGIDFFNLSFDGAETMHIDYDSRFKSFEINYRVKERMRRDRMVLTPSGEWVRTANHGVTKQYLAGLRYFNLEDDLIWRATNIATFAGEDGTYRVNTSNDMFGFQLGCSLLFEHDRWNLEVGGKGGPYVNDIRADSAMTITNDPTDSFVKNNGEKSLAFVGEFQLIGRYHLRPNVSLRAGWQMMYITSVALAPNQIDFSPDEGRFPYSGDPFYNGAIFGLESYW